jgi:uncharacterized protein YbgA (DUF1722 family)
MHLEGDPASPRLVTIRTHEDHTERMIQWARRRVVELEKENLCGFVFKSNSPSSGMERIKVYDANKVPAKVGVGMFARAFMEHFPLLPVEDDGRLHDPILRENFIEQVFALRRWREFLAGRPGRGELVAFHTAHKLQILAHSPSIYREMGRLVAEAKKVPEARLLSTYERLFLEALHQKASIRKNRNVLLHMMGYFKKQLTSDEKQELIEVIDRYAREIVPLIVPVTLMRHYVRKYHEPYLGLQWYLDPHPTELALRNHA